ncbi:hypothetical protein [Arthrobacter bambusae]|uniref:Centromere-binding protein ParB C-terminal domain-containing protein n=1 Tax=Arthrobacter bambusae TaxID=1338426 RepID=A0AAW8D2P8_9MICC|nr:hypothetical protein [Arthrobacter bambusae]MDP9903176.1 hypothetical protein [Arthrobacter bambusae]MDQ0128830.1 hypothetical protein [Arthrobacter bambusae]MDQ0180171.1 hypothetical protein [Arthrobacter bambusae]
MCPRPRTNTRHHDAKARRDTGRKPRTQLHHSTAQEIADTIAFENGLGGGPDSEYRNIVLAAKQSYDAGFAAGAGHEQSQPAPEDELESRSPMTDQSPGMTSADPS